MYHRHRNLAGVTDTTDDDARAERWSSPSGHLTGEKASALSRAWSHFDETGDMSRLEALWNADDAYPGRDDCDE